MSAPARSAPIRARPTSDVTRGRDLVASACVALLVSGAVLLLLGGETGEALGSPGPLARPHARAGVACAACHGGDRPMAAACAGCHGVGIHASTRTGHQRMARDGRMSCASCHPAHAGAQGVTFVGGRDFIRWGNGAEVLGKLRDTEGAAGRSVALVRLSACGSCHDRKDPKDPLARCASEDGTVDHCFDEHQRPAQTPAPPPPSGVACAKQHEDVRYVAWEAARDAVASSSWVSVTPSDRVAWAPAIGGLSAGSLAFAGLALGRRVVRRRAREAAPPKAPTKRRLPAIDASTCIGCHACVDACPFDVLEVSRYVAVVARPDDCCGVVLCEQACPNGSLTIQEEDAPVEDRLGIDDNLEVTGRPGLYLAGDITGLPLIKNAILQGVQTIDRVARTERGSPGRAGASEPIDVVVVGAGPAGLSAALRAQEKKLGCVVLEQATIAASIKQFPRNKLVYDPPLDLPLVGTLPLRESTKEELVAEWTRIVRKHRIDIREEHRVVDVAPDGEGYLVRVERVDAARVLAAASETLRARHVILATGRRGTPRTLAVEIDPAAESRVSHALVDARAFSGQRVLVVGLGDTAMEAIIALSHQPSTTITVCHRGAGFTRGKARNIREVERLARAGRIRLLTRTEVARIGDGSVTLDEDGKPKTLTIDRVLVLIGGVPAWDLLDRAGVRRGPTQV